MRYRKSKKTDKKIYWIRENWLDWSFLWSLLISERISSCSFLTRSSSFEFSNSETTSGDDIVLIVKQRQHKTRFFPRFCPSDDVAIQLNRRSRAELEFLILYFFSAKFKKWNVFAFGFRSLIYFLFYFIIYFLKTKISLVLLNDNWNFWHPNNLLPCITSLSLS